MNARNPSPELNQPSGNLSQSLTFFIIEHGCHELEALERVRCEGWQDDELKGPLDRHFETTRRQADDSAAEDDARWIKIMASVLENIDKYTNCIPRRKAIRFLDLGCCPGGFSKYVLDRNPDARGVGVSLEVEQGGHDCRIPSPQFARFKMHWGDLTFYDVCLPMSARVPCGAPPLKRLPFAPGGFRLVMLDGHHRRPQESSSTRPWDIDRLLIAQLIIALQSLDLGGTLLIKLSRVERSYTAKLLHMLDNLSTRMTAYKPRAHATRGTFYAVARGVGLGGKRNEWDTYLGHLKKVWWELTFGGDEGQGRWLLESDLDFIIDFETLRSTYLDRLIHLGRGPWRVQKNALEKKFSIVRKEGRYRLA